MSTSQYDDSEYYSTEYIHGHRQNYAEKAEVGAIELNTRISEASQSQLQSGQGRNTGLYLLQDLL